MQAKINYLKVSKNDPSKNWKPLYTNEIILEINNRLEEEKINIDNIISIIEKSDDYLILYKDTNNEKSE